MAYNPNIQGTPLRMSREYDTPLSIQIRRGGRLSDFNDLISREGGVKLHILPNSSPMFVQIMKSRNGSTLVKLLLARMTRGQRKSMLRSMPHVMTGGDNAYYKFIVMNMMSFGVDTNDFMGEQGPFRYGGGANTRLIQGWIRQWNSEHYDQISDIVNEGMEEHQHLWEPGLGDIIARYTMGFRRRRKSKKRKSKRKSRRRSKKRKSKRKSRRRSKKRKSKRKSRKSRRRRSR
jgi:hypothetical protein